MKIFVLSILLLFAIGCSSNNSSPNNLNEAYSGILSTDHAGNILGGDTTDWLPIIADSVQPFPLITRLLPVYPNPCYYSFRGLYASNRHGGICTIRLYHSIWGGESMLVLSSTGRIGYSAFDGAVETLPAGIYRLEMNYDFGSEHFHSYGDIEVIHNPPVPTAARNYADTHFSDSTYRAKEYELATLDTLFSRMSGSDYTGSRAEWEQLHWEADSSGYGKIIYLPEAFVYELPATKNDKYYNMIELNSYQFGYGWDDEMHTSPATGQWNGTSAHKDEYHRLVGR